MITDAEREERLLEMGIAPLWRVRPPRNVVAESGESASMDSVAGASAGDVAAGSNATRTGGDAASAGADPAVLARIRVQDIAQLDWERLIPHIAGCTACGLGRTRRNAVPGVGNVTAQWMFVGEAPGAEEDAKGEPFVGQAGRLLDNMLRAIGLERNRDVYIANVLKCRPPNNRNPEPDEVSRCAPYLERQLELIRPRLIIALGRFAAMTLLDTDATIASLRGRLHQYRGVPLIVTYHPAYLLRSLPEKAKAWEDLVFARRTFMRLQNEN
jgi:DNA polymerase